MKKVLVYGYGNPGRGDDGLGPALAERLGGDQIEGVVTDSNYQLQIEDAVAVSQSDTVIFVDAATDCEEPFVFSGIKPSNTITFTTHSVSPASILALCHELYGKSADAYILAIRGYSFEFTEKLSREAEKNLEEAYLFIRAYLAENKQS